MSPRQKPAPINPPSPSTLTGTEQWPPGRRPLTDFFSELQILNAHILPYPPDTYCYRCDDPLTKYKSYCRIGTAFDGNQMLLCHKCATNAKRNVIQARQDKLKTSRHFEPLTPDEQAAAPSFKKPRRLK